MLSVGDQCETGQVVTEILGQGNIACCFFTEDKHIRWQYFENGKIVPAEMMPAVNIFDNILRNIAVSIPQDLRRHYYVHAAKSLYSAFHTNDPNKIDDAFGDIQKSLRDIRNAPVVYSVSGLVASIACMISTLLLLEQFGTPNSEVFYWAVLCSIAGSALSVMARSRKLWSDPNTSTIAVILQGSTRPIAGAILGVSSVILIRSEIILASLDNNIDTMAAVALFFGLCESAIPEMSKSVERRVFGEQA
ncbi:hypothetical protein [Marinagarivorans cellulosilyticus]|uniref:Uncharacterized protein n=1 Tax=Marinagarivorans cellulosilyticus TaxID=2721545 RepID=A0AAN2BM94_9GAMM|nr:hypothetical protein [Marinagarivorans cellulosilyticus]BCD99842.1 hypothetical protein MARGE09_P4044 [Marinagarivorans cellulosilyticus]